MLDWSLEPRSEPTRDVHKKEINLQPWSKGSGERIA